MSTANLLDQAGRHLQAAGHLTDEQFTALLCGQSLSREAEAHLAACGLCQEEASLVGGSVSSFNEVSREWAEQVAPSRVPVPSRWAVALGPQPMWRLGGVAMATVAALALVTLPHLPKPSAFPAQPAPASVSSIAKTDLASDNRLMASIQEQLQYAPQTAVSLAELRSGRSHAGGASEPTSE